jgi:hypothetical protein
MGTLHVKFEGKRRRQSNVAGVSNKMPGVGASFLIPDRPSLSSFPYCSPNSWPNHKCGGPFSSHGSGRWTMAKLSVKKLPLVYLILQENLDSISSGTNRPPLQRTNHVCWVPGIWLGHSRYIIIYPTTLIGILAIRPPVHGGLTSKTTEFH